MTSPPSLRTASEDETIRESADANDGAARSAVLASALSIVSVAAKTLTTFFMVPLVVSAVGPTHCALWILVNTVTMYLSLSEAGIAQTIINFVGKAYARDDYGGVREVQCTSMVLYGLIILPIGLTSLAVVAWTPAIHLIVPDATASDLETFRTAVTFTIPIAMARIPLLAFPATLTGLRHLPTRIVCEIISTMSAMLATVIVAYAGGSVVSLCVASNLVLLVTAAIPIVLLRRLHRWAIFALRDFNRSLLPQIGANSLLFFLISLSYLVDRTGANMLVSACGRLELVSGMYLLLTLFRTGGWSIVFLLSRSIQPHAILWANTNRTPHLLTTTVQVTRLTVLVAALIALGITGCAPAICELVLGTQLYPGDVTLIAIGLTFLIEATFLTTINILVALNHSRLLATFLTAKTSLALVLALGCSQTTTVPSAGIAIGFLIANAAAYTALPWMASTKFQLTVGEYCELFLYRVAGYLAIVAGLMGVCLLVDDMMMRSLCGVGCAAIVLAITPWILMTREERERASNTLKKFLVDRRVVATEERAAA